MAHRPSTNLMSNKMRCRASHCRSWCRCWCRTARHQPTRTAVGAVVDVGAVGVRSLGGHSADRYSGRQSLYRLLLLDGIPAGMTILIKSSANIIHRYIAWVLITVAVLSVALLLVVAVCFCNMIEREAEHTGCGM